MIWPEVNLHDFFIVLQYITVSVLFIEICIVFFKWKNAVHSYLFIACIASFISNMGYLLEMKATTEEAYISALKLSYVGRVWIVFAFFLFSAKMCNIRIPKPFLGFLMLTHVGIYLSILTIGSNNYYYTDYTFIDDPAYPRFYHSNGYFHDLLMSINAICSIVAFYWVVREYRKEKNQRSKQRLLTLIISYGIQIVAFIAQLSGIFSISYYYDLTMPGALFGTIFLLIGILGFDLLGTREIARHFAIDRISEGIIAVDNDGRIKYYNEPAANLFPEFDVFFHNESGLRGDITLGNKVPQKKALVTTVPSQTPYDIISKIINAVKCGETITIGDRIYSPEENDLVFKGENYGKLYALVDDTDHFKYMEELQKQRDIADSANEAKSRFLANMSHEIRTPINAILGMDEMILRESGEKNIRSYASDIMSASRTLLSLINDILDLSKVEEGKMEIIPVQYDLSTLIADLVNVIRDRAEKKGLVLHINAEEKIPRFLFGDEIRIRQCAMNILTNAVKYTREGSVSLDVTFEKKDESHILLKFKVEDTGIGMKSEDMENLFSPYKRIEEKRNRAIEGTGLGMSITRQLLELMGTALEVQSEYGKGSVFSFTVVQEVIKWEELGVFSSRYKNDPADTYEYHELFHAPDAKILVVDDTEVNLTVIRNLLVRTLIGIDTAMSGKKALELAEKNRYDAIFIDHMMPDMDGIETLQHIRESGKNKDVPAIALTANAVSGAREMYLDAGFADYLSKPVDSEKLERMLMDKLPSEKIITPEDSSFAEVTCRQSVIEELSDDVKENTPEKPADDDRIKKVKEIAGIDVSAGLKNCGSAEGFISVLSVFHQTAQNKADEIEDYYKKGDVENYTVKVHALKSSARIVGASQISELAARLEDAGKNNDTAFISDNTDTLLKMFRQLDDALTVLDKADISRPLIEDKALKEAYNTIIEIAGSMDYGLMDDLFKELDKYAFSDADAKRIGAMKDMLQKLDWDGIVKTAGEGK